MQVTDRIIKQFPEVDRVLGKAGRAETATDPAPLSMFETVITLKPKAQGGPGSGAMARFGTTTTSRRSQLNEALKLPGMSNAWTMPIKARIDMLSTGMRTPVGLKIQATTSIRSRRSASRLRRCSAR